MTQPLTGKPIAYVYVTDLARALAFYRDALGLTVASDDPYGASLNLGAGELRITVIPDHKAGEHPAAGLSVPDVVAVARDLKARGIDCLRYDYMEQDEFGVWTSEDGKSALAFFSDPDGNMLCLQKG